MMLLDLFQISQQQIKMSKLSSSNIDSIQKSAGVGDIEVFLHRECMQWKAVYLEGKYFIADPTSVNKLLQIQAQIELQKRLAYNDSSEQEKAQSFHSYYNKIDKANDSYVTEVNHQRQKLNEIKVEQELEKQQNLYAQRIAQARNKKKEKKKGNKNLVKMGNTKQEFKSVKMQNEEKDNVEVLQKSMLKVQTKRQDKLMKTEIKQERVQQNRQDVKVNNIILNEQKGNQKQRIEPINSSIPKQSEKINVTAINKNPLAINSIVCIQINEAPKHVQPHPNEIIQIYSPAARIKNVIQLDIKGNEPSILSLDSSVQKRIDRQVDCQRAGDQFFFQLHSKIDELQQNIGQMKNEDTSVKKISSPPPMVQQNLPSKFKQSAIMIDTKNMLRNLNSQLKEIGLVDPEQDSNIVSEYVENLTITKVKQDSQKIVEAVIQPPLLINQNQQNNIQINVNTKRQNKQLHVQQAFNIVFSPIVKQQKINHKQQNQIEGKGQSKQQNCKIVSSLLSHQIVQVSPNVQKGVSQQRQKLNQQISLLKQVIGQLRVERIKYQSSSNDKATDQLGTHSILQKNQQQGQKEQMSYRVNASIFNNFTQSAVSQIHSNQYRSMISKRVISGKIVKNISPTKMAKIEEQKMNEIKQRQISENQFQSQHMENTINQDSKMKSKQQSLSINIQEAKSVKIPTGSEDISQNIEKQEKRFNNIEIVNIKNQTQIPKHKNVETSKGNLMTNNSIKIQLQMQSSMPRPLNRHNRSQPPKLTVEQYETHQKKYQSNMKRKLINNFEQQVDNKAKYNTISHQKVDPKRRANREGALKTIQSKPASFHPELNKVVFNKAENNLKAKIIQIQKSRPQKMGVNNIKNNAANDSKSSKGFRLRRQSQASRQSRASSSIKDAKLSSKGSLQKQEHNKIYVPALQGFQFQQQPKQQKYSSNIKNNEEFKESKASTYKIEKRKIQFNYLQVPKFPQTPNTNIRIEEMAQLIKKMNSLLNLQLKQGELHKLIMKKYKNCIMLDLPNPQHLKLVWHYNGKIYVGQWNQSAMLKQGEGLQYMPEKYYYKGQFNNGKRHGNGIMVQQSGSIYQGQWEQGQKCGRGKFYDATIKLNYEGQWKNGKRQGIGYLSIQNQSNYQGNFLENYKDGLGTESFYNGDSYQGQYSKNRFHGKGTYIWSSGDVYQGQFYEGCKHGKGLWTSFIGETYQGYYKNDKKCGSGKYLWGNGCTFEGEFQNDKKNGHGVLKYPDGREINGIWREGKLIQQFASPRKDDKEDPLTHRKSKIIETVSLIKVENKQHKQKK